MKKENLNKPEYWRSIAEYNGDPELLLSEKREFPKESPFLESSLSRRKFLGIVGATTAIAVGNSCTNGGRGKIIPYTKRPIEVIPGVANYYASSFAEANNIYSILVKTREGRPIHIDGNDEHPEYKGKTHLRIQSEILSLYDPERLKKPLINGKESSMEEAEGKIIEALKSANSSGKGVFLLSGSMHSPSSKNLIASLKRIVPSIKHMQLEPSLNKPEADAMKEIFGESFRVRYNLENADVILSLNGDFLGTMDDSVISTRKFIEKRNLKKPSKEMNRLFVAESGMTLTGSNADLRIPLKPSDMTFLALTIANELHKKYGYILPADMDPSVLHPFSIDSFIKKINIDKEILDSLIKGLADAGKHSLVIPGLVYRETHVASYLLNRILGAEGNTILYTGKNLSDLAVFSNMESVLKDIEKGLYSTIIIWNTNPAYYLPMNKEWEKSLSKINNRFHLTIYGNETSKLCNTVIPVNHWLESWNDYEDGKGTICLQQPAISPLYDTKQGEEIFLSIINSINNLPPMTYYEFIKNRWERDVFEKNSPVSFESFWNSSLHDGFTTWKDKEYYRNLNIKEVENSIRESVKNTHENGFTMIIHPDLKLFDGRHANNAWLQELPDPITKMVWGNALSVSPADGKNLNLSDGDEVSLEFDGKTIDIPVIIQPGQAKGVVSAPMGYGMESRGAGNGIGTNIFRIMSYGFPAPFLIENLKITKTDKRHAITRTQEHYLIEGRDIVRSCNIDDFLSGKNEEENPILETLYPKQIFPLHKWGMAIDLGACTGCSGCVIACQSENNIPIVGKEQVSKGREMHWVRIDRYYDGTPDNPRVLHQPMLCQQCEDAPCENVCPVAATTHSEEGLNQMAYNRCIGTRYCANNCPYKVRRFNFFDFTSKNAEPMNLAFNPEVTVRPRGVMEKCTFCIQRIEDGKIRAKSEGRKLADGEIRPACAVTCPSEAIVFGDLNDPESMVSKLSSSNRGYKTLSELGIRPSITYMAKLRNPPKEGENGI